MLLLRMVTRVEKQSHHCSHIAVSTCYRAALYDLRPVQTVTRSVFGKPISKRTQIVTVANSISRGVLQITVRGQIYLYDILRSPGSATRASVLGLDIGKTAAASKNTHWVSVSSKSFEHRVSAERCFRPHINLCLAVKRWSFTTAIFVLWRVLILSTQLLSCLSGPELERENHLRALKATANMRCSR